MQGVPECRGVQGWTDGELVDACLAGEQIAWSELIRRYTRLVLSIAAGRGLVDQDAHDLNQLVWTQVYVKLESVRDGRSFRGWLSTLTRNACFHFGRKRRRIRLRETDSFELSEIEALSAIDPYDPSSEEARARLRAAIAELPDRSRTLIDQLYFTQPKPTYREVAERLGVAEGSVGALRDRCLKRLYARLEPELAA